MTLTYGVLLRGVDILYQFNSIVKFPSISSTLNGTTELSMPGLLYPIVMDNGNIKGQFELNVNLIDRGAYDPTATKGTTGNIFEQYFDLKRVIDDLGIFISGSAPDVEAGTSSTQRYNTSASSVNVLYLVLYMDVGNGDVPFSSNYDIYDDDYIKSGRDGIIFNVTPTHVNLDKTNIAHTQGIATIKFSRVKQILPFRTTNI